MAYNKVNTYMMRGKYINLIQNCKYSWFIEDVKSLILLLS